MDYNQFLLNQAKYRKENIVEAYQNGTLIDIINETAIEIERGYDGNISKIIFTVGGPYVYLDFDGDYKGRIVAFGDYQTEVSPIPLMIWDRIQFELEELLCLDIK